MTFEQYWQQAIHHHGSAAAIERWYPKLRSNKQLIATPDNEYLSMLCRRVFRAGMTHSVVDSRWPAFEEAFWKFDPLACQLIDDARFEQLMQNPELIRHWTKMKTIPVNALMVSDLSRKHDGFGNFLAQWPVTDITGLWQVLKKQGAFLGGVGGARFLRMAGKDTFVITDDVTRALVNAGVVTKTSTSQKDIKAVQSFFNELHEESGKTMGQLSIVLAMSIG